MNTPGEAAQKAPDPVAPERQILIAGIGEAWASSQGAGGPVARSLGERDLPSGVSVHELGTGALDIAYDVMRGYDAVILIDVSANRGGAATAGGTTAVAGVSVADEDDIDASIEDGQTLDPNATDPKTVLHFIKHVGGWPGKVVIVPCAPDGGDAGAGGAVDLAFETIEEMRRA